VSTKSSLKRRAAAVAAATTAVVASSVVVAGPASAGVPDGWPVSDKMNALHLLTLILFIPVVLAIVIALLVLLPGILRGEGLLPRTHQAGEEPQAPTHAGRH